MNTCETGKYPPCSRIIDLFTQLIGYILILFL
jgi:hypothetical protein